MRPSRRQAGTRHASSEIGAMGDVVNPVVAMSPLDAPCLAADVEPVPDLRWVLAHLLEETARHAGHADILRELTDGKVGR